VIRYSIIWKTRCLPVFLSILLLSTAAMALPPEGEQKYHTFAEMTASLNNLAKTFPNLTRLTSIGATLEKREIWMLQIANPAGVPPEERPALFIGANLEGDHLIGSELALFLADYLVKNYESSADVKQRLDHCTIYIVPRINPDGAERMWAAVKTHFRTNAVPFDGDNDGRTDEDGPLDLNQDGMITLMRVKDANGAYRIDPQDARLMKKADAKKGERGEYSLYWEGRDQDQDGFVAEDGPGGVNINRNFMHEYPYYRAEAGRYMVSEPETRALLDFLLAHRNIAAMLTFGESDNLVVAPNNNGRLGTPRQVDLMAFADAGLMEADKVGRFALERSPFGGRYGMGMFRGFGPSESGGRGPTGTSSGRPPMPSRVAAVVFNNADIEYHKTIGTKYIEMTGIRQTFTAVKPEGALFQYGYFQYGIPSFSTPGWGSGEIARGAGALGGPPPGSPAARSENAALSGGQDQVAPGTLPARRGGGAAGFAAAGPGGEGPAGREATPEGADRQLLQWMDKEKVDGFVSWTPFRHTDLGEVEIGGFKPYATVNPPAARIGELGKGHADFVLYLTSLFPQLKLHRLEAAPLGGGLYRITAEIENSGFLPTALAHAVTARAVKPILVQIQVAKENILAGKAKSNSVQVLAGSGGREKFEWLIRGKKGETTELKIVSEKAGTIKGSVVLP